MNIIYSSSKQFYLFIGYLAKVSVSKDDPEKAKNYLIQSWNHKHDHNTAFELGMVYLYEGKNNEAKYWFETSEKLNSALNNKLLGRIYLHYKLLEWAAEEFEKVIACANVYNSIFLLILVNSCLCMQSIVKAKDLGNPPDTEVMLLLAECKEIFGDEKTARLLYEQTINVEPYNALAHAALGLLLLGTGA